MKKFSKIIILTGILCLAIAPMVSAVSVPGDTRVGECCIIKHDLDPFSGESTGPIDGDIVGPADGDCQIGTIDYESRNWAAYCTVDTVYTVSDWVFWIAFIIAAIMIVIGAITFMTAAGSADRAASAKTMLTMSIIGIVVAVVAKFIPAIARYFVGV